MSLGTQVGIDGICSKALPYSHQLEGAKYVSEKFEIDERNKGRLVTIFLKKKMVYKKVVKSWSKS